MKYSGGPCTSICYDTVHEDLAPILFLEHGSLKVLYVCTCEILKTFDLRKFSTYTTSMPLLMEAGRFSQLNISLDLWPPQK